VPIMQRTRIYPALGKAQEVEAILTEAVEAGQGQGRRVGLARRILTSEGPGLVVTLVADDVAAIDRIRQQNQADAAFQARAARLASLVREPTKQTLLERVGAGAVRTGVTVVSFATASPAPGKEAQVLSILDEFVKDGQGAGVAIALWRRIFSSEGSTVAVLARYADLAELDKVRKERASITRAAVAAVGELSRAPVQQRILETVVALPPA
jgi:quinol monooxygenase YgiN